MKIRTKYAVYKCRTCKGYKELGTTLAVPIKMYWRYFKCHKGHKHIWEKVKK